MTPDTLGPYRIDRELGSGGMGKVYAATVTERTPGLETGATVALKVVHPHLLESRGFFKRFMREAQIGQAVVHDNVVRTLDCDAISGSHFLVMEYVEGQTLQGLLRELEQVPEELCRHVAREICKGLAAIHAANVVHRDLKPENVLITEDHVVKVMDLGVARLADEQIRLSRSGAFVGSAEYAAPEQFEAGDDVDGRCDLHALGLLLYELSCGQHPYRADGFRQVMKRVCEEAPRRLGDINPQLSAFFEEVVHTLLAKSRDDRFQSADDLFTVLEEGEDSEWWHERAHQLQATTKRPIRRIRIPRETAVYGREKELARLRGLYDAATSGDAQVVLIEGEAGIGKSRLMDELISRLQADGEDLNFLFGSYPPGGAASAAGAFSTAFREQMGEEGAAAYLPQTPLLVPAFEAVLKGDIAPEGVEALTKDSLATCFIQAARVLGAERPTIVLIDDLHFAPEEARGLFSALAMALPGHRVLLVGTTRPGVEGDWRGNLQRFEHVSQIQVERLFPKDLAELLRDSFQSEHLANQLGNQIAIKSDGNPFFAFEIIRGLREGQFITQGEDGTWVGTQIIEDIQIPSSVLDLVNARVSSLDDEERNLLDVAACWGYEFDASLVGEALGLRRLPVLQAMAKIEKRDRLVRSSGREFVFDHHQVQEALYGALPEMLREEYHAALAEALETRTKSADKDPETLGGALCVDLAEHYLKSARGESALRYLPAAQTHLTKGYLHAQVVELTERALAVPRLLTGTGRAKALLRLEDALDTMGRRARQEECAREAERLAEESGDAELRRQAATALGILLQSTSRHTEAEEAHRRALELALALGDQSAVAGSTVNLGNVFHSEGRIAEAREHYDRGLALCREIGHRKFEAIATLNLGGVYQDEGRLREAREHYERSLALFGEIGDRRGEAGAIGNLGNVLSVEGRVREARKHYERSLAIKREIGDRAGEATSMGNLGGVSSAEGRLREARDHFQRALTLIREIGDRRGESRAMGNLGVVLWSEGRLRDAQEHQERYLAMSCEIGHRVGEAYALHNLGGVLRDVGETAPAVDRLLACQSLCEEIGERYALAGTHLALGSLRAAGGLSSGGDGAGGQESLAAARDLAAELGMPGVETLARCELACLPGGDAADALAAFTEHDERLSTHERREARWLLFRATGDRAHLEEAKRLLDESVAHVDDETKQSMLTNLRLNREIMAAWTAESGHDGDADADPDLSETRAG